ncbi:hypothetical protein TNCV_2225941 [Trichonephila clavipes]|nr:hypothetical protein TNCV_2225941 [Trichonephila clavipes]
MSYRVLKRESQQEENLYILQFFFGKVENTSQVAEIVNCVYGVSTVTVHCVQFWFCRFPPGMFIVEITEMIEVDWHVSSRIDAQKLNIDHKAVLNHLHNDGLKKKLDVGIQHKLSQNNMTDLISIYEALAKRNKINPNGW